MTPLAEQIATIVLAFIYAAVAYLALAAAAITLVVGIVKVARFISSSRKTS